MTSPASNGYDQGSQGVAPPARERVGRGLVLALLASGSAGCFSIGGGGAAWVSHRGTARYEGVVQPMVAPEVRSHRVTTQDRARFYSFQPVGTFGYTERAPGQPGGFTSSVGPALGVDQFWERTGVGGLLTLGGIIGPEEGQGRFFVRTQLRLERELNDGDWRIDPPRSSGLRDPNEIRTGVHHVLSALPGLEFVAGNRKRPWELNFGLALQYRMLFEVASIGP